MIGALAGCLVIAPPRTQRMGACEELLWGHPPCQGQLSYSGLAWPPFTKEASYSTLLGRELQNVKHQSCGLDWAPQWWGSPRVWQMGPSVLCHFLGEGWVVGDKYHGKLAPAITQGKIINCELKVAARIQQHQTLALCVLDREEGKEEGNQECFLLCPSFSSPVSTEDDSTVGTFIPRYRGP